MSQYFPKPYEPFVRDINVKINLSNYATKTELKRFAPKLNLASLKTELDKLDINKLAPVPDGLSKLSDIIKNHVVKKTVYDKLVQKGKRICFKDYNTDKSNLEKKINDTDKKIPDTNNLAKKADLNAKITEIENKIPSITGLATNLALTAVENKIPDVSSLVTKTDYNTKISDIEKKITDHDHDEYITTSKINKLTTENVKARLAQANLVTKTDCDAKLKSLNKKINSNKTKHLSAC